MIKKFTEFAVSRHGLICSKLWTIMRLVILLITLSLMQVSAASLAQRVTLRKEVKLSELFAEIKKQTGYNVVWNEKMLDASATVHADYSNLPLENVLDQSLANMPLTYTILKKTVVIREKPVTVLDKIVQVFSAISVKGRVVDEKGDPLPGATIRTKDNSRNTISDKDGSFYLTNVDEHAVLLISFVGYQTKELAVKPEMGNIKLDIGSSALDDVQIIAYGTTTKRLNTGSQAGIKADVIEKQPVNNPLEALSGRIPRLDITQQSGAAGTGFTVRIRGINSVRPNANDPLFIVDGIPYTSSDMSNIAGFTPLGSLTLSPLNALNASDIESIDVLKDADATAIYGSRGANGVILITTKRGGNTQGKTNVDFNIYEGVGGIARYAKVLDARQYLDMRYKAFKNDGVDFHTAALSNNYDLMTFDTTRNTNWQRELLGGTAQFQNAQITISGGNGNTNYTFAGGVHRQTSVYRTPNADVKYNGRFTLDNTSANKKFKMQLTTTYANDDNHLPTYDLVSQALSLAPIAPPLYNADGSLNFAFSPAGSNLLNNPVIQLNRIYEGINKSLVSNGVFSYQISRDFAVKSALGITNGQFDSKILQPASYYAPAQQVGDVSALRTATFEHSSVFTWNIEPQLTYNHSFGKHEFNVLVGTTFQETKNNGEYIRATGFKDDNLLSSLGAASSWVLGNSVADYKYNAVFARISYNYENRYILNLTGRRDGSTRFGPGHQFGNFGAIGAAWLFDEENFIKKALPFLSYGKLRASYGITGNDVIGDYGYLATYSPTSLGGYTQAAGYGGGGVLTPDRLENADINWETNRKAEAAIELGFLKNRILLNIDYYNNRSSNSLINYTLAATTGFTGIIDNLPATIQNTGLEFELTTTNITGKNFNWTSSFNLSLPKNKLIRYDNLANSSYKYNYVVGQPLNIAKVANMAVDPQTGIYVFRNAAGAVTPASGISLNDINTPVNLGKQYYGGLDNSFTYKNFTLDFFLQFTKQTGPYTNSSVYGARWGRPTNLPEALYQHVWQNPGDATNYEKLTSNSSSAAGLARFLPTYEPYYYVNASYVRLKNVSLSYSFPQQWVKRLNMQQARLYLQGQNLLTFTNYPGMDPENESAALPPLRVMTFGIQVTF